MTLPPFQQLLDAHGSDIHRFLLASVGRNDADDCYQETWLSALRAYPRLRSTANLRGWLFTIAHRKAIDHTRRRPVATAVAEVPDTAGASSPELDHDLWAHVRELPAKQRAAIVLRFIFDADYAEVGSVMNTTPEAARRSVHEGLKRLRTETSR